MSADTHVSATEFVLQPTVDAFGSAALVGANVLGGGQTDQGSPSGLHLEFPLERGMASGIRVDERDVAQRAAVRFDLGGIVGRVHQVIEADHPLRGERRQGDSGLTVMHRGRVAPHLGARADGARATEVLTAAPPEVAPAGRSAQGPLTVGIDGGMVFVDQRWQEVKLACLYDRNDRVGTPTRGVLTRRAVVAVRGTPEALAARLWPQAAALGADHRRVVVLGDGAPWIWHLAEVVFPDRVEILDLYHADEHISAVARILYGESTEQAATWRTTQLDRLATDGVDHIIASLRFLGAHHRTVAKRTAVTDLTRYLTTNRERMRYQTFRAAGYAIGSGAVESAVSHVVQQRMKRVGMRWRAAGADAMLALRSILPQHRCVGPILDHPSGSMNGCRLRPARYRRDTGAIGRTSGL